MTPPNPIRPYVWGYSLLGVAMTTGFVFAVLGITAAVQDWRWLLDWLNWWTWTGSTVALLAWDKERYEREWWQVCEDEYPWRYREAKAAAPTRQED